MRLAIVDLGTNSVRFDVHELGPDNQIFHLHREKLMIRLGEGVFLKHRLSRRSIDLCIEAFQSFKKTIEDFRVLRVVAFGTSALREAKDGDRLIREIKKKTGISIQIISGSEEARLISRGVIANETNLRGRFALVDIGGGSTEVTVCSGKKILRSASFPLGTARLQQVFLKSIPPDEGTEKKASPIDLLRRHIRGVLLYQLVSEDWPKVRKILGSSGTVRALHKILSPHSDKDVIEKKSLSDLVKRMSKMNRAQLSKIPGMESRRIDMILSGAILLEECMNALHAEEVQMTEFSLRDGILDEQMEILRDRKKLLKYDPLNDLYDTAKDLGCNELEIFQSQKIAEDLFNRLKPLHRLDSKWKIYLLAAAILHDTGKAISPIDSSYHSFYVARYADVPAFEDWESKLIAELCAEHKNGKIQKKDLPWKKNEGLQRVFLKLLAILRISTAFSYQRRSSILIDQVRMDSKKVVIKFSKRHRPDLGILRADQKRQLFEEVFKRELMLG
ncbi:MAG: Ppx/GppA family phosphatase [Deltaproteobacteria bacterium]|nr:Ppx/GppA family phosphatase [Deltaproteobacteria bacterium]